MSPVLPQLERLLRYYGAHVERSVKMREQRAAARGFPFDQGPEHIGIDFDENKVALSGKVLGQRACHLCRRRQVNVAVAQIVR